MAKKYPYGLKKIIRERTGKSWHIITKTMDGDRVDPKLAAEITVIVNEYLNNTNEMLSAINKL